MHRGTAAPHCSTAAPQHRSTAAPLDCYSGSVAEQTPRTAGDVIEKTTPVLKEPDQWRVLLLNDDYTPMDFVVEVLESVFHKPTSEAYRLMMQVHTQGSAVAGVYTHEVAETRVATVIELAQDSGYPLHATMELA
jgi:ATP-dependent Clp protease adaptor protein ClpS